MNATAITANLNKWNSKQEFRQKMLDRKIIDKDYMTILRTYLSRESDSLKRVDILSKALMVK